MPGPRERIYVTTCCYVTPEIRDKNTFECKNCGEQFTFEELEKI